MNDFWKEYTKTITLKIFTIKLALNFLGKFSFHLILYPFSVKLPNNIHTIDLDDHMKLTWLVEWSEKQVLFRIHNAFYKNDNWFSFGFSKRGGLEQSDSCYFIKNNTKSMVKYIFLNLFIYSYLNIHNEWKHTLLGYLY